MKINRFFLETNKEGYLANFTDWTRVIGKAIAKQEGIKMTPKHWIVISWIQNQFRLRKPVSIRSLKVSNLISLNDFYRLFGKTPLRTASRIAGIPKPRSCM